MPVQQPEDSRLAGRNGAIWRAHLTGVTQEAIAAEHGISQSRVSQVIRGVRESIPDTDRAHLVQREAEFLERLRAEVVDLWQRPPIPAYSNGKMILMPPGPDGTQVAAEDHSGRLAALDRAVRLHERLAKLLGLDAPAKADVSLVGQERDATSEAAAAALAFLEGSASDAGESAAP